LFDFGLVLVWKSSLDQCEIEGRKGAYFSQIEEEACQPVLDK